MMRAPRTLSRRLLERVLHEDDRPFVLADLDEEFEIRATRDGKAEAMTWYRAQTRRSLVPALRGRFIDRQPSGSHSPAEPSRARWADDLRSDLRSAFRGLRRSPGTIAVTVISLGIGIGGVTAVSGIAKTLLFGGGAGVGDPEGFVTIYTTEDNGRPHGTTSWPDYEDIARQADALATSAVVGIRTVVMGEGDALVPLLAEEVGGDYFEVMRMRPALGRGFLPEEADPNSTASVAFISHGLWEREFARAPSVLGRTLRIGGEPHTIVGVAPEGVVSRRVPLQPDVWIPFSENDASAVGRTDRARRSLMLIGRLADGATIETLSAQLDVVSARLRTEHPEPWVDANQQPRRLTVLGESQSRLLPEARMILGAMALFFLGATGLILLIACANVGMLHLARASTRGREMAVRLSLGASRRRLIRMFLVEGLVPGIAAGALGLVVVAWINHALSSAIASIPFGLPIGLSFGIDGRVIAIALVLAVCTSVVFGLLPAIEGSRPDLLKALKGDGSPGGGKNPRLRNLMVTTQCAASFVLLVGALLFVRSLSNALDVDVGWDADRIAVATKQLDAEGFDEGQGREFIRSLQADLIAHPDVEDAHISRVLEMTLLSFDRTVPTQIQGGAITDASPRVSDIGEGGFWRNSVTPGYLDMLGATLLSGRPLSDTDVEGAPPVAVVNETFSERLWPGEDPIGRSFQAWGAAPVGSQEMDTPIRSFRVVGLVEDGKYFDFDDPATPYFWTSIHQDYASRIVVSARGTRSAESVLPVLREKIELASGEIQLTPPTTLASMYEIQVIHLTIASTLLRWASAFGLFLSLIGIYGIVSFAVNERTREMAIRLAIGAEHNQVMRGALRHGLMPTLYGLVIGGIIAFSGARLLSAVLVGVAPLDPIAYGGGALVLGAASLLASIGPARRSMAIDPMRTLREE